MTLSAAQDLVPPVNLAPVTAAESMMVELQPADGAGAQLPPAVAVPETTPIAAEVMLAGPSETSTLFQATPPAIVPPDYLGPTIVPTARSANPIPSPLPTTLADLSEDPLGTGEAVRQARDAADPPSLPPATTRLARTQPVGTQVETAILATSAEAAQDSSAEGHRVVNRVVNQVSIRIRPSGATQFDPVRLGRVPGRLVESEIRVVPGQPLLPGLIQQDIRQLHRLGLFSQIEVTTVPSDQGVTVIYELMERPPSQVSVGGGTDRFIGTFGRLGYRHQEMGVLGQQLDAALQVSTTADVQFFLSLAQPYRRSQDSAGVRAFVFRDRVEANRLGGGVTLSRPVGDWWGEIGLNYTRMTTQDRDPSGNFLSFSGNAEDDLVSLGLGMTLDRRDHPIHPSQGWIFQVATEQAIPIGAGSIANNRLRGGLTHYIPLGAAYSSSANPLPELLALRLEAATVLGDLRPYLGYSPGDPSFVGFDRVQSYALASVEYRRPLGAISLFGTSIPLAGTVFVDVGTDFGSQTIGPRRSPAQPSGGGIGYGLGLRANSPLGVLRLDVGIDNQNNTRVQLGIGQRF